jgi:hypothetical protein
MFGRPRRDICRAVALLAIAAAAAIAAGTARAETMVDVDDVPTLGSGSFEFRSGKLYWEWGNNKISATVEGEIKLDGASGSCARMRMEYWNDNVSIIVKHGGTVCPPDGKSHSYTVDLNPYGDPDIDLVKLSLEKETVSGWSIVESAYFKPTLTADTVRLTAGGVDFGNDTWGVSSPVGSGTLDWGQGEGMNLTPHLTGTLYLNNVAGLCARVALIYLDELGAVRGEEYSGRACAPGTKRYSAAIDLAPFTSSKIERVTVKMQTQTTDGSWHDLTESSSSDTRYITAPLTL